MKNIEALNKMEQQLPAISKREEWFKGVCARTVVSVTIGLLGSINVILLITLLTPILKGMSLFTGITISQDLVNIVGIIVATVTTVLLALIFVHDKSFYLVSKFIFITIAVQTAIVMLVI